MRAEMLAGLTQNGLPPLTPTRRQGFEGRISGPPVGERPTRLLKAASKGCVAIWLLVNRGAPAWVRPDPAPAGSNRSSGPI